jgi:hypothetical protein
MLYSIKTKNIYYYYIYAKNLNEAAINCCKLANICSDSIIECKKRVDNFLSQDDNVDLKLYEAYLKDGIKYLILAQNMEEASKLLPEALTIIELDDNSTVVYQHLK